MRFTIYKTAWLFFRKGHYSLESHNDHDIIIYVTYDHIVFEHYKNRPNNNFQDKIYYNIIYSRQRAACGLVFIDINKFYFKTTKGG